MHSPSAVPLLSPAPPECPHDSPAVPTAAHLCRYRRRSFADRMGQNRSHTRKLWLKRKGGTVPCRWRVSRSRAFEHSRLRRSHSFCRNLRCDRRCRHRLGPNRNGTADTRLPSLSPHRKQQCRNVLTSRCGIRGSFGIGSVSVRVFRHRHHPNVSSSNSVPGGDALETCSLFET